MKTEGHQFFPAPPDVVLAHLSAPDAMMACIPVLQDVTGSRQQGLKFTASHQIGPLPVSLKGRIAFSDPSPDGVTEVTLTGSSFLTGSIVVQARLRLIAKPKGTRLEYAAETEPTALIRLLGAERGERLFGRTAAFFFQRMRERIAAAA